MGFLSKVFGGGESKTRSAPAKPTPEQTALQKQALRIGDIQEQNIRAQTQFQTDLFSRLMAGLEGRQLINQRLFGGTPAPSPAPTTRAAVSDPSRDALLRRHREEEEALVKRFLPEGLKL